MEFKTWTHNREARGLGKSARLRVGRFQFTVTLMCHRSTLCSDRWVVQTSTVYDRKDDK